MEKIKIKNLIFSYPNSEKTALNDINLTVNQGEFVTICGKSGCGKSTLLRHLKPILTPHGKTSGEIYFNGKSIYDLSDREQAENIGFVMQNPDNQIVTDKVWHELVFGLESLGINSAEIRSKAAEMASFFGIQNWFYENVANLSGGQKQILNLASVMVMNPTLLLLDEPSSQLDPISAHDFFTMLERINTELGVTIILSEHNLSEVFPLSDKVVVMEDGKITAENTPYKIGEELKQNSMFAALPTPTKIYYSLGNNSGNCPITIRDGHKWLEKQQINEHFEFKSEKNRINTEPILELKDVWFRYEKNSDDILKGLSFKVHENEFYAIVGGNGVGKSTALSVISKINKPYRGKVFINDDTKVAVMPQNPQSLFLKKSVLEELYDAVFDVEKEKRKNEIEYVMKLCELDNLLENHPYDLSGGEQQRVALAKMLLRKPDLLVLDEPTKGFDACFKRKLAMILKSLQKNGMTVLMVTHDIEFCAEYADICAMFFDGNIVSEAPPRKFFAENNFYTTSAKRMADGIIENAVLDKDVIRALGGEAEDLTETNDELNYILPKKTVIKQGKKEYKKLNVHNVVLGIVFVILFVMTQCLFCGRYDNWKNYVAQTISILFIAAAMFNLIPRKKLGKELIQNEKSKRKISKRTKIATLLILFLIPLTIFIGIYYLGDKKYYFISLLIILETMIPFGFAFENRKPKARELVIISALCAIGVAGRTVFFMLPQFKPVAAIVIISGVAFGGETGFLVGAITAFVSNFFFGQGPWTPWQMFSFGIIGFLAGIMFQKGILRKTKTDMCVFGFLVTFIIYGGIMNPASVIMWQSNININMVLSSYVMGMPFDFIHAVSTVFFLFFAAEPMLEKLERIKIKYGLIE
ncbi:MAG: ECF transporter S component [Hominilimicola sp.]|uniref:ECF transporter S component n=1 Tax=Hominilimicola sp. TaxID=3073571 RepID=UPI00399AE118